MQLALQTSDSDSRDRAHTLHTEKKTMLLGLAWLHIIYLFIVSLLLWNWISSYSSRNVVFVYSQQ